jgi:hypothetical protein
MLRHPVLRSVRPAHVAIAARCLAVPTDRQRAPHSTWARAGQKLVAPPMVRRRFSKAPPRTGSRGAAILLQVYIAGEEMTNYAMKLIL